MRRGIEARATRSSASTGTETSAADEQPGTDAAVEPPASSETGTETASTDPRPKLSRSQRKALRTAEQPAAATSSATEPPPADTSAPESDPDPIAHVERVERTVSEGLARLESLIATTGKPEGAQSVDPTTEADRRLYGDDAEFVRRATIATRPNATGEYLSDQESRELETWAINRDARDRVSAQTDMRYRQNYTALTVANAERHGVDADAVLKAPTFDAIYDAFVDRGRALERESAAARDAERVKEIERLTAVNQQLADDLEGYERRSPGLSRGLIHGGMSGSGQAARIADRARMNGRQQIRAALASGPRKSRPGAR